MIRDDIIKKVHNQCVTILNKSDLSKDELVTVLAQLLIHSGQAVSRKEINIHDMNLHELYREYYAYNEDNDIGLGLILNGSAIMAAIKDNLETE